MSDTESFAQGGYTDGSVDPLIYQDGCALPLSHLTAADHRAALHSLNVGLKAMLDNNQE